MISNESCTIFLFYLAFKEDRFPFFSLHEPNLSSILIVFKEKVLPFHLLLFVFSFSWIDQAVARPVVVIVVGANHPAC